MALDGEGVLDGGVDRQEAMSVWQPGRNPCRKAHKVAIHAADFCFRLSDVFGSRLSDDFEPKSKAL